MNRGSRSAQTARARARPLPVVVHWRMPRIASSSHGESRLRMLRIVHRGDRHDPRDLSVSCRFEGDFPEAFLEGRPGALLPGEALKNLVHTTAREQGHGEIERFGLAL